MSKTKENAKVNWSMKRLQIHHLDALLNLLSGVDWKGVEQVAFKCTLESVFVGYLIKGLPITCLSAPPCQTRSQWEEVYWQNFWEISYGVNVENPSYVECIDQALKTAAKCDLLYLDPESIAISIHMKKNRCGIQNINHILFQDMYNVLPSREFRYGHKRCQISYGEYSTIKVEELSEMSALEFDKLISDDLRKSTGDAKTLAEIVEQIDSK